MNLVHITTLYPGYIADFEARHPEVGALGFADHRALLYADSFGWSDYYVKHLSARGHTGFHIIYNYAALQHKWARENGTPILGRDALFSILKHQVIKQGPEIIFVDDCYALRPSAVQALKGVAPTIRATACYHGFDSDIFNLVPTDALVLTCSGPLVDDWRKIGYHSYLLHHAYEPSGLSPIFSPNKAYDLSFIGNCSPLSHPERHAWLRAIIQSVPALQIWSDSFGLSTKSLRPIAGSLVRGRISRVLEHFASPLRNRAHGALYGRPMYALLRESAVTLNCHVTQKKPAAGNMRLFEATGEGACLLTDAREDLVKLFTPDSEVVTYNSTPECIEKARWLLDHPAQAREIALRGQQRTLRDHTFAQRAIQLEDLLLDHLKHSRPAT